MDPSPVFNTLPLSVKIVLLVVLLVIVSLRTLFETFYSLLKLFRSRPDSLIPWRVQRELKFHREPRRRAKGNKPRDKKTLTV